MRLPGWDTDLEWNGHRGPMMRLPGLRREGPSEVNGLKEPGDHG